MIIAPRDELEMGELEISWGYGFFVSSPMESPRFFTAKQLVDGCSPL